MAKVIVSNDNKGSTSMSVDMLNSDASCDVSCNASSDGRMLASSNQALEQKERGSLAREETKAVSFLRTIIVTVMIISTILVSVMVYYYGKNKEIDEFETHFAATSAKVVNAFHDSFERKLSAADSFSTSITSYAITNDATFPNVTLPHFSIQGSNSRLMADGVVTYWLPLVTNTTKDGWEAYSKANEKWMDMAVAQEDLFRQIQDKKIAQGSLNDYDQRKLDAQHPERSNTNFRDRIFSNDDDELDEQQTETRDRYLPLWQMTPAISMKSDLNYDMLTPTSFLSEDLAVALDTKMAVMSKAVELTNPTNQFTYSDTASLYRRFFEAGQFRHESQKQSLALEEPTSNLIYPVFDNFGPNESRSLVGVLTTSIFWSFFFTNTLPMNSKGIIVVLENTKNQTFSYEVDGNNVIFLGCGDKHNTKFDHLEVAVDIRTLRTTEEASYTSVGYNADYCTYTLRVYPSEIMEGYFCTNEPIYFSFVAASIFILTSIIFSVYDCLVERRQTVVMNRAVASGAMISELFPENVQSRLFHESSVIEKTKGSELFSKDKVKDLLLSSSRNNHGQDYDSSSEPIADYFTSTTIMFGDLAGFTAWSSNRNPKDVFTLLETIYGAFDEIAIRDNVFKVETIGDCYVAVTGLPNPQPDHALIMAKFAHSCMVKMNKIVINLKSTLGEDTGNLMMRIGLHSGPITAGVLRGQKARFQLFGDTINTAARIESNGIKGRIHVSQQTADQLIAFNKVDWLSPREDPIVAKGKGILHTYWLAVPNESAKASTENSPSS